MGCRWCKRWWCVPSSCPTSPWRKWRLNCDEKYKGLVKNGKLKSSIAKCYAPARIKAKMEMAKLLREMNLTMLKAILQSTAFFSFKIRSRGRSIFFIFLLRDSAMKSFGYLSCGELKLSQTNLSKWTNNMSTTKTNVALYFFR